MYKKINNILLLGIGCCLASFQSFASEQYTLDPKHTYILWHANHFDFSSPSGKWMASGTLDWDKENPQNSKVNVNINMADLTTGIPELDKHLKAKLFFDVAQFPSATFVSNKVQATYGKITRVNGILTIHGVSKSITLEVKQNKTGLSPITDQETLGFSAHTQLKRSDFGIKTLLPGVGDNIEIEVQVEAYKPK